MDKLPLTIHHERKAIYNEKRILGLLLALCMVVGFLPTGAMAAESVAISKATFPDPNFRTFVAQNYDKDQNGTLSAGEIAAVTEMVVYRKNISDLTGIEYFTALTSLDCEVNQLTALDVSQNTALKVLHCGINQLTALDVSQNTALQSLYCYENQLIGLNLDSNTALKTLSCHNNRLVSLDLSKNTALQSLYCYNNRLTSLDVIKNTDLRNLYSKGSRYPIMPNGMGQFDLRTLPGSFSADKASGWTGGTVSGTILTVGRDVREVTYTYDCGGGKAADFTLEIHTHTPSAIAGVPAACEKPGLTEGSVCAVCGEVLVKQTEISALGHTWGAWISNNDASYDADGTKTRTCTACGKSETVTDEGSKRVRNSWQFLDNNWYFYDNGTPVKGWKAIVGNWYYFDEETGVMWEAKWLYKGGRWYFLKPGGATATG